MSWYKNLSNLSGVLGLLDLELPEVELGNQHYVSTIQLINSRPTPCPRECVHPLVHSVLVEK